MIDFPTSAEPRSRDDIMSGNSQERTSAGSLLVAAAALRAWGAENDAEAIEEWVAQQRAQI